MDVLTGRRTGSRTGADSLVTAGSHLTGDLTDRFCSRGLRHRLRANECDDKRRDTQGKIRRRATYRLQEGKQKEVERWKERRLDLVPSCSF